MGQKNLDLNMKIFHVMGKLNGFADAVSQGHPSLILDTHFKTDYPANKSAFACLQVKQLVNNILYSAFS